MFLFYFLGCNQPIVDSPVDNITFTVVDVGQGLSQIAVINDSAVVFDMGPSEGEEQWRKAWAGLGSPPISAIYISHRDLDHSGGLQYIDGQFLWTGKIIAGYHEDTAFLRKLCSQWGKSVQCSTIRQNDSITIGKGCTITCIWPPDSLPEPKPVSDGSVNHYSLALMVRFAETGFILTGDIDSSAEKSIFLKYGSTLKSDIMVVPHHGSRESVDYLFYAYIKPSIAVISAGLKNDYGHPAPETLEMLARLGILYENTAFSGSLSWRSNGFYWTELF